MSSGYVLCPCCGYDTVASDDSIPELCSECEAAGCDPNGDDSQCDLDYCNDPEHDFEVKS